MASRFASTTIMPQKATCRNRTYVIQSTELAQSHSGKVAILFVKATCENRTHSNLLTKQAQSHSGKVAKAVCRNRTYFDFSLVYKTSPIPFWQDGNLLRNKGLEPFLTAWKAVLLKPLQQFRKSNPVRNRTP